MREYGDDLSLGIYVFGTDNTYVYGVEIEVTYSLSINEVIYGTTELIDLTEDTVTPDDLSEGITAHDQSGGLITGTNQRGILVIRDSSDSHGGTVRTITSGEAQIGGMTETELNNFISRSTNFTDIDWPDGVDTIGFGAFMECRYFNPSSLPSTVTAIRRYAFYNCTRLALSSLPSGLGGEIGDYAFYGCTNLALTSLPNGITNIGSYAFYECSNLALTSLPSSLTTINSSAFYGCGELAISTLPSTVKLIYGTAFYRCTSITSIECEGEITTLGNGAFTGRLMQLASASFPNMALTSALGTVFGSGTADYACQLLEFCDIGSTTGIAASAFANCYALQTLVLRKSDSICTLGNVSAFTNTPLRGYNSLTGTVYVPQALISTYQTATNWSTLYNGGTVTFAAIEGSEYERD